jgi:dCTP deaminase
MILSDGEIDEAIQNEGLVISSPEGYDVLIKSASVDMRLDPTIQVIRPEMINQSEAINPTTMLDIQSKIASCSEERKLFHDQPFVLEPGVFLIGSTAEKVELPNALAARIDGKSSLARFGVQVHLTAPKIDPGWRLNKITLEIVNLAHFRVTLYPMMEIAALIVERLGRPSTRAYSGRFTSK